MAKGLLGAYEALACSVVIFSVIHMEERSCGHRPFAIWIKWIQVSACTKLSG